MSIHSQVIPFASIPDMDRRRVNGALLSARPSINDQLIGRPRGNYGTDCQPPTNPVFQALLETADVGPFRCTGIRPAVSALKAILVDVKAAHPDLHGRLGTAGMQCCRFVRGSTITPSSHSWGIAIDLTIDGQPVDPPGDDMVQRGLLDLWPIFNAHGFYWGAAFPREDSMHFEASDQLVRKWSRDGALGAPTGNAPLGQGLTIGDRGPQVAALQNALNRVLTPVVIDTDGLFGPMTRAAVIEFQRRNGLRADGVAGRLTQAALGLV